MSVQKLLIIFGVVLVGLGIFWPWISRLGLGSLPGDISVEKDNFSFYMPLTSSLLFSLVFSLVLWLMRR